MLTMTHCFQGLLAVDLQLFEDSEITAPCWCCRVALQPAYALNQAFVYIPFDTLCLACSLSGPSGPLRSALIRLKASRWASTEGSPASIVSLLLWENHDFPGCEEAYPMDSGWTIHET